MVVNPDLCDHGVGPEGACAICHGIYLQDETENALSVQVGGDHYKDMVIQPVEYIHKNKLGYFEGNVVKYITRHRLKGQAADVRKAKHYCELLLEMEYGES